MCGCEIEQVGRLYCWSALERVHGSMPPGSIAPNARFYFPTMRSACGGRNLSVHTSSTLGDLGRL